MLDFHKLQGQFRDFAGYRRDAEAKLRQQRADGRQALRDCASTWQAVSDDAQAAKLRMLVARLREDPSIGYACGARPDFVTVVATDGSQIYPDRHIEPACYLLNVGCIAFQYGTTEPPVMQAAPSLRYRQQDLLELQGDEAESMLFDITTEVVSALRDEQELHWLFETARDARRSGRPILAMADGTLIRWMVRGMKNRRLEDRLLGRYLAILDRFQDEGIPVCSYISMPGTNELVNLLRFARGEDEANPADDSLLGLLDRHVIEDTLAVGERSGCVASGSHILDEYGPHRICAFYVRTGDEATGGEIARVELPEWVADQREWVDLIHAVVLDQSQKGGGYPIILQEAHERAVVRQQEKALFYHILNRQMHHAGMPAAGTSLKAASKRAPRV
ncbi:MAG: DNA double-strand break repair nuclease NurA [Bacteroidota bacterium]